VFIRVYWTLAGPFRSKTNRRGMTETLTRIKSVAESNSRSGESPPVG
jgi:hypothetical protein